MKKKIIVPAVLVTVAVISVAWWLQFGRTESSNSKVFISGNIEATEVDLSFRIGGQITRLPIEEGDRVEAGKMVAELDRRTLLAQKGAAEAEIANARAVLDELEAGTRTEVIEAARAATKAEESRMINARAEYERYLPLLKEGAVSRSIFDAREMTYRVATEDYNNAKERLIELEAGPRE